MLALSGVLKLFAVNRRGLTTDNLLTLNNYASMACVV